MFLTGQEEIEKMAKDILTISRVRFQIVIIYFMLLVE